MKIGILSDTHGAVGRAIRALELLLARECRAILHCGDIGSEEVLHELAALCRAHAAPLHAVLGNVDLYDAGVREFSDGDTARVWGSRAELELAGKRIAILHGHEIRSLMAAISSGEFDYVFTGHTHQTRDERAGRTRVVNPGAVHRANPPTVAALDLATDALEFISIR